MPGQERLEGVQMPSGKNQSGNQGEERTARYDPSGLNSHIESRTLIYQLVSGLSLSLPLSHPCRHTHSHIHMLSHICEKRSASKHKLQLKAPIITLL